MILLIFLIVVFGGFIGLIIFNVYYSQNIKKTNYDENDLLRNLKDEKEKEKIKREEKERKKEE